MTSAAPTTVYDSGVLVGVVVNGSTPCNGVATYGEGATATSLAASLASAINASSCSSWVTATSSGTVVTITAKTLGAAADYTLGIDDQYDTTYFSSSSFTMALSGGTMTGGSATVYASGTITIGGAEQSVSVVPYATGTITAGGTEQSTPWRTGTFTIAGTEQSTQTASAETAFTDRIYSPGGTLLALHPGGGGSALIRGTIPLPGGGTAVYNSTGLAYLRHKDWLGSSRLATTWTHGVYAKEAYAPFGETYNEAGTADRSFTGQDQDTTSGVYDYLFRKYDPAAGRWLSPDPLGWGAVQEDSPQTLNRYAYVVNSPMRYIDPDGEDYLVCGVGGGASCSWMGDDDYGQVYGGYNPGSSASTTDNNTNWYSTDQTTGNQVLTATAMYFADGSMQDGVDLYFYYWNTFPAGHFAIGLAGQPNTGFAPKNQNLYALSILGNTLPGTFDGMFFNKSDGGAAAASYITITADQAAVIQAEINSTIGTTAPEYDLLTAPVPGTGVYDCVSWAQMTMNQAGINTGSWAVTPLGFLNQLNSLYYGH